MNNEELKQARFLSVSALNRYISYKFDVDAHLQTVYLEGEISNFKRSGRNFYFSIKDEFSEISGMMFYPNTMSLDFEPVDGTIVQMVGKINVYEKRGTYSIIVKKMIQAGIGLLYQQFLDLKDKLQKEGLFDTKYKKPLPEYPENIAVITSPTGEAINDITSTIRKRYPLANILLYPSLVQGDDAPLDLIRNLRLAYQNDKIDCLIIGRGGGSFEDLACFNDETLARVLFEAPFPTISAVGHEGDYTICDFVASHRAPTPTGAAMLATKDKNEIFETISIFSQRLTSGIRTYFKNIETRYENLKMSYGLDKFDQLLNVKENQYNILNEKFKQFSPDKIIERQEKELVYNIKQLNTNFERIVYGLEDKNNLNFNSLNNNIDRYLDKIKTKYQLYNNKLVLLNPLNIMEKGYSVVYKGSDVVSSIDNINIDDEINVKFIDGTVKAKVLNKNEE